MDKTFVMIKPNAIASGHIGEIIERFEKGRFKITAIKMFKFSREQATRFYDNVKGEVFFEGLLDFMTGGPCVAMIVEYENAVAEVRKFIGPTNPDDAIPGTIRHDYGERTSRNSIHASDCAEKAKSEIEIVFGTEPQ